jgi:AraC family transcriptional regulator
VKAETRRSHRARIECAVEYIQDHLAADLELEALARRSGMSPYHFHRVFRALVGEPPKAYVRRLRLELAARQLRHGAGPIRRLARRAGYETHEAFCRAFRAAFGCSPTEFRARAERPATLASPEFSIERLPQRSIAFLRGVGPYDQVADGIEQLLAWAEPLGLLDRAIPLGVFRDDQAVTPPRHTRYEAALLLADGVAEASAAGGGVGVRELPDRDYAVMQVDAPYRKSRMWQLYHDLFTRALPARGLRPTHEPVLEVYTSGPRGSQTRVHVPLA